MTALVGPSGSGKSTIAKLIAGFWDAEEGAIMIDGVDEKKIPLKQLYDKVAFVSQDNYLFDTSVRENIRMGNLSASDKEVEQAAKAAANRHCEGDVKGCAYRHIVFHMLEVSAIYFVIVALTKGDTGNNAAWTALAFMAVSIIGNAVTTAFSKNQQTHAGYFMAAIS